MDELENIKSRITTVKRLVSKLQQPQRNMIYEIPNYSILDADITTDDVKIINKTIDDVIIHYRYFTSLNDVKPSVSVKPVIKKYRDKYIINDTYIHDPIKKIIIGKLDKFKRYVKPDVLKTTDENEDIIPLSFLDERELDKYKLKYKNE